jgi:hypothetical protein
MPLLDIGAENYPSTPRVHQRVVVCVDRQHEKGNQGLAFRTLAAVFQDGRNAQRLATSIFQRTALPVS